MGISRSEGIHQVYLPYKWLDNEPSGFKFHQVDINNDLELLKTYMNEFQPEYVVNFAAQGMVAKLDYTRGLVSNERGGSG